MQAGNIQRHQYGSGKGEEDEENDQERERGKKSDTRENRVIRETERQDI